MKGKTNPLEVDLFNLLPDWAWIREVDGRVLEMNDVALARLGRARGEVVGKPIFDFYFEPADRLHGDKWAKELLKGGSPSLFVTFRDKRGQPLELEQHGRVLDWSGRQVLLIVARDVGPQLRDRRLGLILYEAFRRSNDVMFYCDRNGVILDVNEAFEKRYGFTREEAVGQTPRILKSRHSTKDLYERMWSSIKAKGSWRGEMINRAKDGREIPLLLTITGVHDARGEIVGYISNAADMSEHMALQARVADSEALASIGEMAAVVAHEIRNPLGSIVMAAKELAHGQLSPQDREVVMNILRNESARLNESLTNFLAFARPRELKLARTGLNALIDEVARAVQSNPELMGDVRLSLSLSPALKPFPLDPDQIRQIIWNMVINALQAMGGQGTLTLKTGQRSGHAYFSIGDTGPGITEKAMATLFKPFQTTKQQGTGLGLAVADRIVKAHGGSIDVKTGGTGTTFTVSLPPSGE
jgi:PAS domain S-box-containing protein